MGLYRLLLAHVFDFTKNPKLQKFLNGDHSDYPSPSEADLGFCSQLAGLGLAAADIDRVVRLSGLYREKWNELHGAQTYGEMTIQKALESPPSKRGERSSVTRVSVADDGLLRTENGTTRAILENAVVMLRSYPELQGLKFSEFTSHVVMTGQAGPRNWTDADDSELTCRLQRDGLFVSSALTAEAISILARGRPYHEVREYLAREPWDHEPRLETSLIKYFGAKDTPFHRAVGHRFPISAVARVMCPGVQVDHVPVFLGPQGLGKSSGVRAWFGDQWYSDHPPVLGSKDSLLELSGKWCLELTELTAVKRSDVEAVKSFLTARIDYYRKPYARRAEDVPRQNVFCGTSNDESPFVDPTGSRRFWPVPCGSRIDVEGIKSVRNQLWAEAYWRFQQAEVWWMETAELRKAAASEAETHYQPGPWDQQILDWCERPVARFKRIDDHMPGEELPFDSQSLCVTLSDVLLHCIGKTLDKFVFADQMQVQRCLTHAGYKKQPQCRSNGRRVRFYKLPPPGVMGGEQ